MISASLYLRTFKVGDILGVLFFWCDWEYGFNKY